MGTQREEAITLRREVGGRTGSGAAMAVAAGCTLAGVVLGFGLGRSGAPPAAVSVVRPGAPVYAVPCPGAEPRLILIDDGEGAAAPPGEATAGAHEPRGQAAARESREAGVPVQRAAPAR